MSTALTTTEEDVTIVPVSSEIVYQQDKAQIDVQISTAKAYPRNVKRSMDNCIAIVSMDMETAKTCTYSVPRGGKSISGPSVHMAKIVAQQWGNLRIEAKVVAIDDRHVTSEAVCFDLETNIAIKTQVKRSIMGKAGRFNDDMITVTGNAANSIALRNAIYAIIPRPVIDRVYASAKAAITGDISTEAKLKAKRKQVMDGLRDTYSVTEAEILASIGKAAIDHITADDLVVLIGIGTAIKDGDTTVDSAFRGGTKYTEPIDKAAERAKLMIADCTTVSELNKLWKSIGGDVQNLVIDAYDSKGNELQNSK